MKKIISLILIGLCLLFSGCGQIPGNDAEYDDTYEDLIGDYYVCGESDAFFPEDGPAPGLPSHTMKFSFWEEAGRAKINIKTYAEELDRYLSESGISETVVSKVTVKMNSVSDTGFIVNVHHVPFNEGTYYRSAIDGTTVSINRKDVSGEAFTDFDDGILCVSYTLAAHKGHDSGIFTARTEVEYTTQFTPYGTDEARTLRFTSSGLSTDEIPLKLHEF